MKLKTPKIRNFPLAGTQLRATRGNAKISAGTRSPLAFKFVSRGLNLFYAVDGNKNISDLFFLALQNGVALHYEYSPFGLLAGTSKSTTSAVDFLTENPFRFSSQFFDTGLDLIYYNYRHYSPLLGRFLSRDPLFDRGGVNLYAFCGNDPINYVDNLGEMSEKSCQKMIDMAQTSNRRIRQALEAIGNKEGCRRPEIICECCNNNPMGYFDPSDGDVRLCRNNLNTAQDGLETLLHELVHAWNNCNGQGGSTCESAICDEISAYLNDGGCQRKSKFIGDKTKECVIEGAISSVEEYFCNDLTQEELKEKVKKMYGKCSQIKMPF